MQISAAFQSSRCGNNGGIASIIFRGCLADLLLGRLDLAVAVAVAVGNNYRLHYVFRLLLAFV